MLAHGQWRRPFFLLRSYSATRLHSTQKQQHTLSLPETQPTAFQFLSTCSSYSVNQEALHLLLLRAARLASLGPPSQPKLNFCLRAHYAHTKSKNILPPCALTSVNLEAPHPPHVQAARLASSVVSFSAKAQSKSDETLRTPEFKIIIPTLVLSLPDTQPSTHLTYPAVTIQFLPRTHRHGYRHCFLECLPGLHVCTQRGKASHHRQTRST